MEERAKLPAPLLIGLLVALIAVCVFFAIRRSIPDGGGTARASRSSAISARQPDVPNLIAMSLIKGLLNQDVRLDTRY